MRSGPLWVLQSANIQFNTQINRHAWVGWLFVYLAELIFFAAYRLSSLGDLVKTSTTPDEDTTPIRIYGVLLGVVQDFIVTTFLVTVLSGFDAAINRSACCNDTAPNGLLDCFTRGIPFPSRAKLILKRLLRFAVIYAACLLSVAIFTVDMVSVRVYRRRFEFGWSSSGEGLVVTNAEERRTHTHTLVAVLVAQGVIASVTTVWLDLARWIPFRFAARLTFARRPSQGLPTEITSRPSVNYLVMDADEFFDSGENENLSEFFDSENRPIRGTQPPPPAILSDDRRDLPTPRWKFAVLALGLGAMVFIIFPLFVLLITSYCPPAVASIALNANLNEPIRVMTTLSFLPS